ncbi:MAG: V-type ATP synthase subunit E [Treponema sp.]|nr:V-type ATP synthase subunit E [Treponema sp.]
MEIQLQELIDKIKKEGIETASKEAGNIKRDAEAGALSILDAARKEAAEITEHAKKDAERMEKTGVAALEQASRNLLLSFKSEIQQLLDKIVAETVAASYSIDVIKGILPDLVKNWAVKNTDSLAVLLPEKEIKKLDDAFKAKLASTLKGGVELKSDKTVDSGFRIAEKDGSAFYDFTSEAVARMLSAHLNPKLAEIMNSAVKGK